MSRKTKNKTQVTRQNITSEMIILLECPYGYNKNKKYYSQYIVHTYINTSPP